VTAGGVEVNMPNWTPEDWFMATLPTALAFAGAALTAASLVLLRAVTLVGRLLRPADPPARESEDEPWTSS
jgi:hypothetical protein